ncbi:MAG TPA: cation-translocating P-type ATPase [bacterium]|nr:cation-translocating P-type ATPase [bacterium]HOL34739.1 cation-translocating P-type ATPase [bacterium]HPP08316.1 cation-translocating P-type ATPase [bacterium]
MNQSSGLTDSEVQKLLKIHGYNEIPSSEHRTILNILKDIVKELMFLLLVACGVIYLLLGNKLEAQILLTFVFVIMGITFYQQRKTEMALQSLKNLSSPRAIVIRNGKEQRVSGREIVPGDIVVLAEGDRVPADGVIISCSNLYIDESFITGESEPVRKKAQQSGSETLSQEKASLAYAGGLVIRGHGLMKVTGTGYETIIGKIGKSLQSIEPARTLVQIEIENLVKKFSITGLILCVIVVVSYRLLNFSWLNGILAGLTLAMAILPEEFPVVLTIFFALGAWRMSRHNVLTRKIPVIETLGAMTVLCVDKTGTITTNRMEIKGLYAEGQLLMFEENGFDHLSENFHRLIEFGILASLERPFDPMEKAFRNFANRYLAGTEHIHENWTLVQEYSLSDELFAMSNVWKSFDGNDYIIAVKGSPEAIMDLCHLSLPVQKEIEGVVKKMADQGLRVLGVAGARFVQGKVLPKSQHDFTFDFIGLVGLMDPPRENAENAIKLCKKAGIKVIMITGDYPATAMNIAKRIGLDHAGKVVTGQQLLEMDDMTLMENIEKTNIFARIMPEQKLRIVDILKKKGEIVGMTGDGVNDAPALKAAHIGIAMGERGTDVARESADIVLLDDDISSIVKGIETGRTIFDNLKKAVSYIISVHVPIIGMSLFPVLMGLPLVLGPVHIVFLEMIIDPVCSTVFEAEPPEKGIMERPPRKLNESILDGITFFFSIVQGIVVFGVVFTVFLMALSRGHNEARSRTITFITLIISNICLILTNRSRIDTAFSKTLLSNRPLVYVVSGALIFLFLVIVNPFLQNLFRFSYVDLHDVTFCVIAGLASILWFEGIKYFRRNSKNPTV